MVQENPRHLEPARKFRGERLDAESLGGVMAAVKDVHPQFLRHGTSPMAAFTGDKCVHAFGGGKFQFVSRAAGDHADLAADFWSAGPVWCGKYLRWLENRWIGPC